ncbi:hypothetical protein [Melissospora conviva]|uniref:hypothetical protein n=1 Tax=Melissospora conviva TaxID=3388432 RepID=UPI003C291D36
MWIGDTLHEIDRLHGDLVNEPVEQPRDRDYAGRDKGFHVWTGAPAAPIPARSQQPHVSGSRERQLPIDTDRIDLTAPAKVPNPTVHGRRWAGDQHGHLSVATRLWEIVCDWRDTLWPDQHLPESTVQAMVGWATVGGPPGVRVDGACDGHPAIEATAAELREVVGILRRETGTEEPRAKHFLGVACGRCQSLSQISQQPGEDAECKPCGQKYDGEQMQALIAATVAPMNPPRKRASV